MMENYIPLAIILVLAILIGFFVIILGTVFGPHRPTKRKAEPYESGMVPFGPGTRRMNVTFYLVAVLFILFDIELVVVLPWAGIFRQLGIPGLVLMGIFLFVLEVAFVYAWKKGALNGNRTKSRKYGCGYDHIGTGCQLVQNRIHVSITVWPCLLRY